MSQAGGDEAAKPSELVVRRVFNNSAVLAVDAEGAERVLLGKGLGFHLHPADRVDPTLIDKTFVLTGRETIAKYSALLAELSDAEIDLARDLVVEARSVLGEHVESHVLLPLADHINFAVRRAQEGAPPIDYELRWEVQHLYPQEVEFSQHAIDLIAERLGVQVPQQEAVPLALHFVNARLSSSNMGSTLKTTRVLGKVLVVVKEALNIEVDENSVDVARLVSHLRYLVSGGGFSLAPISSGVRDAVRESRPTEYAVAERIAKLLSDEIGSPMNDQETVYLTLHINRLRVASEENAR